MKEIYLWNGSGYKPFTYDKINELDGEFAKRGIVIGYGVTIGKDCLIGDRTTIGRETSIWNDTAIGKDCFLGHEVIVGDDVTIADRTKILWETSIGYKNEIGENTAIGSNVQIRSFLNVPFEAIIADNAIIDSAIKIKGSSCPVYWYGTELIHIGCKRMTIAGWNEEGEGIALQNQFSTAQILEYRTYIKAIKSIYDTKSSK